MKKKQNLLYEVQFQFDVLSFRSSGHDVARTYDSECLFLKLISFISMESVKTGHEDFKQKDSQDPDWLIVRCNEGFDGGLPLTGFELEVYNEESVSHINTIYANRSEKSILMGDYHGPIFEVPGLELGRNYRLLLYAVNAKGRSHPVTLEPVSLKGVAMYTTGEFVLRFNHTPNRIRDKSNRRENHYYAIIARDMEQLL